MKKILTYILPLSLILICGCERKEHTPPPVERVALTTDFFKSAGENRSADAVFYGKTILRRNPSFNHVQSLISIHESNEAMGKAQLYLDQGKVNEAYNVVFKALKLYPDNEVLKRTRRKIEQLKSAEAYFAEIKRARSAAAISEARETIQSGLSLNMTPELQTYLARQARRERLLTRKEQQNTLAVLEEASKAAEKAKEEDAAREAENIRFMEEMADMSEEGQKMREEAGPVPFDHSQKQSPENEQ